ncbi:MAG: L-threonylcarbamoyladenylate synthase [Myxococcaceae bacterium]
MAASAPILEINAEHPNPRHVERAVEVLRKDGLVAYPTDLSYALGCALNSKKAIDRLYALKQRDRKKPLAFMCPDLSAVAHFAHVSNFDYRTMRHLSPGPFTFVLEATRLVPEIMTSRQKQVGIRVPDAPFIVEVMRALGTPLVTSSASDDEGDPLVDARDVKALLGHGLDLIFDGGILSGEKTTVLLLAEDHWEVLRQGAGQVE